MRLILGTFGSFLAALALAGCGAGGSGTNTVTVAILSTAGLDGHVTTEPAVTAAETFAAVGDSSGNLIARGFMSFPLAAIPAGAIIQSATLELFQVSVSGTPYTDLGFLVVDHLDYGATLDLGDFNLAALASGFGILATNPTLEPKTLDVKTQVEADRAAPRAQSQFRLRFGAGTDNNADNDFVSFPTNEAASNKPVLRITYLP